VYFLALNLPVILAGAEFVASAASSCLFEVLWTVSRCPLSHFPCFQIKVGIPLVRISRICPRLNLCVVICDCHASFRGNTKQNSSGKSGHISNAYSIEDQHLAAVQQYRSEPSCTLCPVLIWRSRSFKVGKRNLHPGKYLHAIGRV
jgi:hypothetical protein